MKWLLILVLLTSIQGISHENHQELKALPTIPGNSILQLDSAWTKQDGKSVKLTELKGDPRLVVLLFTKCKTACPIIVEDLKDIVDSLSKQQQQKLKVSIFSIDSERETPKTLSEFAIKRKLPQSWTLMTSSSEAVAELAAALGVRYKRLADGDFIHSNVIYLLNEVGSVVSQKEGLKTPKADFVKQIKNLL